MRTRIAALLTLVLWATPSVAGGSREKVLLDTWDVAYLGEGKAGYVHTIAKEIMVDGEKRIHTTVAVRLTVKRFEGIAQMGMDSGSIETADGKVTGVFTKQYLGQKQDKRIDGTVAGKDLRLTLNGDTPLKPAPWNPDVLGLYKQHTLIKDRDVKPGDKFTYQCFEPTILLVFKADVIVKGYREVLLPGEKTKRKLLLVETVPQKLKYDRGSEVHEIQLPGSLSWFDDKLEQVKMEVDVPGLGPLVIYRTTKAKALAPAPIAQLTDIGLSHLVHLKHRIPQPYETTSAVYRVTIRNDADVGTTFSRDDRQQVKNVKGSSFDLHVRASDSAGEASAEKEPPAEFRQSSYFINSDDVRVKASARQAVGAETDAWKKALRIERWVNQNMRATGHEALATADHVARTLEGDCTEFSMLTAAMCRAAGVPSRTAIGLIYADVKQQPCFAFHMWTEVWIKGRWIPIDATLGKGYVGATHLKITDYSWHDERTMTPIFPVIRVVGRVQIEVLGVSNR